jgi:hypothetical protein
VQVAGHEHIFACGDCVLVDDTQVAWLGMEHAKLAAASVRALAAGTGSKLGVWKRNKVRPASGVMARWRCGQPRPASLRHNCMASTCCAALRSCTGDAPECSRSFRTRGARRAASGQVHTQVAGAAAHHGACLQGFMFNIVGLGKKNVIALFDKGATTMVPGAVMWFKTDKAAKILGIK